MNRTFLIFLFSFGLINIQAQVVNDRCDDAIDLTLIDGSPSDFQNCVDGTMGHDTTMLINNINALIEFPYASMTGCQGYSSSSAPLANDIWYKLQAKEIIAKVIFYGGLDTVHLNVWHGSDCNNLSPSGCFTFDLLNNITEPVFKGNTDTSEFVYLQFSGNQESKTGEFAFCLRGGNPLSSVDYYGTAFITTSNKEEANHEISLKPFPNPSTNGILYFKNLNPNISQVSLFDISGKKLDIVGLYDVDKINLSEFKAGVYFLRYLRNDSLFVEKIILTYL